MGDVIRVRRLAGALGAEVVGVDLSNPTAEEMDAIRKAFVDNIVLVLRDQTLTPGQQVAFTSHFGPVRPHPLATRAGREGHPEVLVLENKAGQSGARNDWWHSDISFGEIPPAASVLYCLKSTEGFGDTMFCNMYAAYEQLSETLQGMLSSLTAFHDSSKLAERAKSSPKSGLNPIEDIPPPAEHPVVRRHPDSGRLALYVNPYFTSSFAGMTVEESRPLLDYLNAQATRAENIYRHSWHPGDVLMWDNRCAMHYGVYDYTQDQPRLMNRTTAGGERPAGP